MAAWLRRNWLTRGQLGADLGGARGGPPRPRAPPREPLPRLRQGRLGEPALLPARLALAGERLDRGGGRGTLGFELLELGGELALAAAVKQRELGVELLDARAAGSLVDVPALTQGRQLGVATRGSRGQRRAERARLLEPHRDALARRARGERASGDRVVALAALRESPFGLLAPRRDARRSRARAPLAPGARSATAPSAAARRARRTRTASRVSVQRASSAWRSRRSCRSAASAWRFSGRRRARASRSTSSARSRFSSVRSSFSWARRRRLRCLPRPAASSISSRRSRGLEVTIASTRPCEITECASLPSPVSESSSSTSTSRQWAPFRRYSPSPARL